MKPESTVYFATVFLMMMTFIFLAACTQLGKGDVDTRNVDVYMRATDDECIVEVKGNVMKEVTDDTVELKHPGGG